MTRAEPQATSFLLADLAALQAWGRLLGKLATPGDLICLSGPLGAGKTTLTQAIAQGLGLPPDQLITSPTFGIIHEHHGELRGKPQKKDQNGGQQGPLSLFHLDLYRLGGEEEELLELGIEDYLFSDGLCVVEWPDRLGRLTPAVRLEIELEFSGPQGRLIRLRDYAAGWIDRLASKSSQN